MHGRLLHLTSTRAFQIHHLIIVPWLWWTNSLSLHTLFPCGIPLQQLLWPRSSWTKCIAFMVFLDPLSQTVTASLQAISGNVCSRQLVPSFSSAQHTILRRTARQSVSTSVSKHFFAALCTLAQLSGVVGCHSLNSGIMHPPIQHWAVPLLKSYMVSLPAYYR